MSQHIKPKKYSAPKPIDLKDRQWPSCMLTESPMWCSVDMRDGNQALPNPMNPEQKLEYFKMLCRIGFKHIEVSFPSGSQDDFDFARLLIEEGHIPDDVFIMGLVQCKPELIGRTFEAFKGIPRGIIHVYLATSELHMKHVFRWNRQQTIEVATASTRQVRELADAMQESDIRYEFSPEEFTDTDLDFAVELCTEVYKAWGKATPEKPIILNLPATVERRPPNQYADMIEWFCKNFPCRDGVLISLHSHNDQGMAVAATELATLAGADRIEGALFGHGERTGNVDLVTVANNFTARGIETGLDFSNLNEIIEKVERLTGMPVYYRQPYSGEYAFTAFSGSHQDAINKGMHKLDESAELFGVGWKIPYLHVDPSDLGREYEKLIRINSQSGKGGIAWVLEQEYGIEVPKPMQPELGKAVQIFSDKVGREISAAEVYSVFMEEFVNPGGPYELLGYWPRPDDDDPTEIHGEIKLKVNGEEKQVKADGNGPVSAFVHCMMKAGAPEFQVDDYHEQAIGKGEDARAMAYVPLQVSDGRVVFGVGTDTNIDQAAVQAIVSGLNRIAKSE
ncbi:2-isopropylmalate synthase [Candidatus Hydrogenedentota bacterium]